MKATVGGCWSRAREEVTSNMAGGPLGEVDVLCGQQHRTTPWASYGEADVVKGLGVGSAFPLAESRGGTGYHVVRGLAPMAFMADPLSRYPLAISSC